MKIKYSFVTGETVEIEVSEELGTEISNFEHQIELNDRAETRRHSSIEQMHQENGFDIPDPVHQVESFLNQLSIQDSISHLQPKQQILIQRIYFDGMSIVDVARIEGVTEGAVRKRLNKALDALKNISTRGYELVTCRGYTVRAFAKAPQGGEEDGDDQDHNHDCKTG